MEKAVASVLTSVCVLQRIEKISRGLAGGSFIFPCLYVPLSSLENNRTCKTWREVGEFCQACHPCTLSRGSFCTNPSFAFHHVPSKLEHCFKAKALSRS